MSSSSDNNLAGCLVGEHNNNNNKNHNIYFLHLFTWPGRDRRRHSLSLSLSGSPLVVAAATWSHIIHTPPPPLSASYQGLSWAAQKQQLDCVGTSVSLCVRVRACVVCGRSW